VSDEPESGGTAAADESQSRLSALWSVLAHWRDWNLPVKLAAVTLVPVIFAIVLGAMQIADQVDRAGSYRQVDRLVVVNQELRGLLAGLQRERSDGTMLLASRAPDIAAQLADERDAVDAATGEFVRAAGRVTLDHDITAARYRDVEAWLTELTAMRQQVVEARIDASTALARYTEVIDALLRFDRSMSAEALDPELAATSTALYDLEAMKEQVEYQHALIGIGLVRGGLVGADLNALQASEARLADRTIDFYGVAGTERSGEYDRSVSGPAVENRGNLVRIVATGQPGTPIPVTAEAWNEGSRLTADRMAAVAATLGTQLSDRSAALQDDASDGAGLAAVILLVALVVAIGVMFVVGRHLLSSLAALRRMALDVAEKGLPTAVARIRDQGENAEPIEVAPVPVTSLDEVGQVARAFDAVQRQALRLATEQAGLRSKYSSVFVNLSRRSQGLVQRQLQLLERLERDEEDADQLATLFQLDHLATRMRRNNENLMVLSGSEVGRRGQRPASLADLLRAAVSEIEQYERVVMLPPPSVLVVGYAVGDLVRLVAELLDNATVFSAPETQVTIASHSFEDGSLCVAVLDEGIGMSQTELDEANEKLADSGSIDVSTSRRMGLFVIGRLAGRHGVEVRLGGGHDVTGVRATVTVPPELVAAAGDVPTVKSAPVTTPSEQRPATSGLVPFAVNGFGGGQNGRSNGHANGHSVLNGSANGTVNGTTNGATNGLSPSPLPRRTPPVPPESPAEMSDIRGRLEGFDPIPEPARPVEPVEDELDHVIADDPEPESAAEVTEVTEVTESAESTVDEADEEKGEQDGERLPLPRRSPGGRMPGPAVGPLGPSDIARPRIPFTPADRVVSPADGLFTPAGREEDNRGSWWTPAGKPRPPVDRSALEETTPIFDEMVSAWFRAVTEPGAPADPGPPPTATRPEQSWQFAADSGFDTARAVSKAEPVEFTTGGLPRRSAGQNLVPGSAGPAALSDGSGHGRDAGDIRERLSNYRHGVRRARDHQQAQPEPQPVTQERRQSQPPRPQDAPTAQLDLTGAGWRFAADVGWRAANSVSTSTPVDFTSGGLPRRTPRDNLVPGSVAPNGDGGPLRVERAEELRGRLGQFQKGLSRGRRSLAERGSGNGYHVNEQQLESE
jgi:signal transduction histidine kinase